MLIDEVKRNLATYNEVLRDMSYREIILWATQLTEHRIVTTSFGVYAAVLLSNMHKFDPDIPVVWVDTGYTGDGTRNHAEQLINAYNLNLHRYQSKLSQAETDALYAEARNMDALAHTRFSEAVKLEPFRRAMEEQKPELWFTNIRVRQTEYRDSKDILSLSNKGVLKVSPFYYWSDADLDAWIEAHGLPKNTNYHDPVKAFSKRECGIHLQ